MACPISTCCSTIDHPEAHLVYFAFDILAHRGKSFLQLPLVERRKILDDVVIPNDRVQLVMRKLKIPEIVVLLADVQVSIAFLNVYAGS
jgi:hypothetical protein